MTIAIKKPAMAPSQVLDGLIVIAKGLFPMALPMMNAPVSIEKVTIMTNRVHSSPCDMDRKRMAWDIEPPIKTPTAIDTAYFEQVSRRFPREISHNNEIIERPARLDDKILL